MATQADVIERVIYQASLLPKTEQSALHEQVLLHLIDESAHALDIVVDKQVCMEVIQQRLTSVLGGEQRDLYSPLAHAQSHYPKIDLATEKMLWKTCALIQEDLLHLFDYQVVSSMSEQALSKALENALPGVLRRHNVTLNQREFDCLMCFIIDDAFHLGPLEPLLVDGTISDILVNGPKSIFVDRRGQLFPCSIEFRDTEHLVHVIKKLVTQAGRRIDLTTPYVDARLPDGSRVNAVLPPLAVDDPILSIRRFAKNRDSLARLALSGTMSGEMAALLSLLVHSRLNLIVSGGTGTGKTTMLNALSWAVDRHERIVTIEDAAELTLNQPHVVRMETKQANVKGSGQIGQRQLVINALRMRPDRIFIGEVRGPEGFDMLQAMNVGHDGSMTTLHANSPEECMGRLVNMILMSDAGLTETAIVEQVTAVVDVIVHVSRFKSGQRRVVRISEIVGMENGQPILHDVYQYDYTHSTKERAVYKRALPKSSRWMDKIEQAGLLPLWERFVEDAEAWA